MIQVTETTLVKLGRLDRAQVDAESNSLTSRRSHEIATRLMAELGEDLYLAYKLGMVVE